jgi:hypothetical protein
MRIAFGLALISVACIFACGGSKSNAVGSGGADGTAGADTSGTGGKTSSSHAGAGNALGDAGEGGAAGGADTPPVIVVVSSANPHAAGGLVAGGVVAHSKHFTGVFSLGASPGGNGLLTSSGTQLRGGVLGASQK